MRSNYVKASEPLEKCSASKLVNKQHYQLAYSTVNLAGLSVGLFQWSSSVCLCCFCYVDFRSKLQSN